IQRKTQYGMNYGDFLIVVHYSVPERISEEEKNQLIELNKIMKMPSKQSKLFDELIKESKENKVDY
ncbi:MAG: hypothetical protein H7644_10100, partial [Candidatus Heimdallarchaeota archaeon]|nr:hypothetical protein [Candidatus Heimdallarchaeota archaeon]MCK5144107.1 hypothetical protein [Candidatus Heimdallarchaeota archaeon]